MKKVLGIILTSFFFFSCSEDNLNNFQKHRPEPEYRLFGLLDDYPPLKNAFSKIDQSEFNKKLSASLNEDLTASQDVVSLFPQFLETLESEGSSESLLTEVINKIRNIFFRIKEQDQLDSLDNIYYEDNFFALYEKILGSNLGLSDDIIKMLGKIVAYIHYKYGGTELEEMVSDLKDFLQDSDSKQNFGSSLELFSEGLGKILLGLDQNMFLDNKILLTERASIDPSVHVDTKLGNAVQGLDVMLSALNSLLKDEEIQTYFFDILREVGALTAKDQFSEAVRKFLENLAKYFIEGGEGFSGDYNQDNDEEYVYADLKNSLQELWPALQQLFIGAGKKNSIFKEKAEGGSPLEAFSRALADLNLDLESLNLEESLARLIEMDDRGRDRTDPDSEASNISFLDALIFCLMTANNFGYKSTVVQGLVSPGNFDPNFGYLHGDSTGGIITLHDTLYSLGTAGLPDMEMDFGFLESEVTTEVNIYSLCLLNPAGDKIFRSKNKFTSVEANQHQYYLRASSPILNNILGSHLAGDLGLPNGGEGVGEYGAYEENTTFFPYSPNGVGEMNTARWAMGLIARVCFEGEGPYYYADPEAQTVRFKLNESEEEKDWFIYYRPNGQVYALVSKDTNNIYETSSWEYLYPAVGNDPLDTLDNYDLDNEQDVPPKELPATSGFATVSSLERFNRYKETWHTDYYLIENHDEDDNPALNKYWAPGKDNEQTEANCLWVDELIKEKDSSRECASQEEAIYKNYQWLMYEKRFFGILPLRINTKKVLLKDENLYIDLRASVFVKIDCNGVMGLANLHKKPFTDYTLQNLLNKFDEGGGFWLIDGGANKSNQPGDNRMGVEILDPSMPIIHEILIYNFVLNPGSFLGQTGYLMPNIFGANINAIANLGILNNNKANYDRGYIEGISSADVKRADGLDYWEKRNSLLPLLVTFLGLLHEHNYYEVAESGHDYNIDGNHFLPFKFLANSILPPLAKPMFYYQKNKEGLEPVECWKPRIRGGNDFLAKHKNRIDKKYNRNYYAPEENRTLVSLLSESEYKFNDGLLPLVAQTKILTKALKLFQRLGSSSFDSSNYSQDDISTWGARRKFFYGLEQLLTSIKTSQGKGIGEITPLASYKRKIYKYEDWMYADNYLRTEDLSLDVILDQLIGSRESGLGLATFVYNRSNEKKEACLLTKQSCLEQCDQSDLECQSVCDGAYSLCLDDCYNWDNFDRFTNSLGALLSEDSFFEEKYNIMEHLINIINKVLNEVEVSDSELTALRHTLGILFATYDQTSLGWQVEDDVSTLLSESLPQALEIFDQHNTNFFLVMNNLLEDEGLGEYMLRNLHSDYLASETLEEWHQFLGIHLVENPDSTLWQDLIKLLEGMIGIMEKEEPAWFKKEFQSNGFR